MRYPCITAAIILTISVLTASTYADVKVRSKMTTGGQTIESTTYIKGKRQRVETMNGTSINITQCDLRRGVQINAAMKTYLISLFDQGNDPAVSNTSGRSDGVIRAGGGTINTTVNVKDTGERKEMFGFTARRLIITTEMASSPDACSPVNMKMETDGWYIDAEFALDCDIGAGMMRNYSAGKPGCQDRVVSKQLGSGKRGYPVYEKMTMFDQKGKETFSTINEVMEFSRGALDASLFEIPAGYREAKDVNEMYAANANSYMPEAGNSTLSGSSGAVSPNLAIPNAADGPKTELGPKRAGVVRIGIAAVKSGSVGEGVNAADLASAVRNSLSEYLRSPKIEVIMLDSKLPSAIDAEAKEKDCEMVVNASVSHKKGGGGFGKMFGSALGSAISATPLGSTGSTAGNVAVATTRNTAINAAHVAGAFKAKDELTIDVNLSGTSKFARQFKAKAGSAGEDIISALVEQAAQAIVNSIGR